MDAFLADACHLITFALIFSILGVFRNFRLMIVIRAVLGWIVGLLLYQKVRCGEGTRMIREAGEAEDSPKVPDGPNITTAWITTDWVPLILALWISKRLYNTKGIT